jgi:hypothetical protein
MKTIRICVCTLTLALVPALALAQETSYDFDKNTNFAAFKSFALKEGTKAGDDLVDKRIAAAIESELLAKGLTKNDEKPDMFVVYHMAFDKQQSMTAYNTGAGYGPYAWRWRGGFGTTDIRVDEILIGTLVVDMADANKQELVWRGMGVKEVDVQAKPEKRDKNIGKAVQKILKNYPPKAKT